MAWVSLSEAEAVVRAVGQNGESRPLVQPLGGQTVSIEPGETLEMTAPVAGPAMLVVFRALHDTDVEFRSDELVGGEPRVPVSDLQGRVLVDPGQTLRLHVSAPVEIEVVAGGGPSNRIESTRGIVFRGATDLRIRHGAPNPRPLVFGLFDTGDWDFVIER